MLSKKIKIGFINTNSPLDRKASSGTTFQMCQSLIKIGAEVIWIKPQRNYKYRFFDLFYKALSFVSGFKILRTHTIIMAKLESETLNEKDIDKCDVLFAPFASTLLYSLKTEKPIIYLSDATFSVMAGYYFKKLPSWNIKEANEIELTALKKSNYTIYASDWAYNSAIKDYNISPDKIRVFEFGANIDDQNIIPHEFIYKNHLDLLFLGVDWDRKGGDIAVEACKYLIEKGLLVTLHIVGIKNLRNDVLNLPFIENYGFLNKNKVEDYDKLVRIIQKSHCLLLPTKAECAGIVFCESSAYGLPIFTYKTGGIANYVYNGKNGYMLPINATGKDFGRKIEECLESGELASMSEIAIKVYKEKLNWSVWGQNIEKLIDLLLK